MKYLSVAETAEKWGICQRRIQTLLNEKRIESATRIGRTWAIPTMHKSPPMQELKAASISRPLKNQKSRRRNSRDSNSI